MLLPHPRGSRSHTRTPEAGMNKSLLLAGLYPKKGLEHVKEAF